MKRREFLRRSAVASAVGAAHVSYPGLTVLARPGGPHRPDFWVRLDAVERTVDVLGGPSTDVWSFVGKLKRGPATALDSSSDSFLGPTLRLRRGQRVRIDFRNRIPQQSIVHWHGLHVPETADGHPRFAVRPGGRYRYEFDVVNRAGTYWYHPHPHRRTGEQVYRGMAGLLIVEDDEEKALALPDGTRDVALVIQDRRFDSANQFVYRNHGGDMDSLGFLGSQILVNGRPHPTLELEAAAHRVRILNGSNSRVYKLGWDNAEPMTVLATDGGLLRKPVRRPYVTLAPGERIDLWVDLSALPPGTTRELRTLEFDGGMSGFGPMHPDTMPMGTAADLLTVRTTAGRARAELPPENLSDFERYRLRDAVNRGSPREFRFAAEFGEWTINGRTFQMEAVAADERVSLGTLEAWDFVNDASRGHGGGMMRMGMAHPVHAHGQQFQVIDRKVDRRFRDAWNTVSAGYVDTGWKDTVLTMPGERVRVLKRFDDYTGLFLIHCHNLEHEDRGMMRNFEVLP